VGSRAHVETDDAAPSARTPRERAGGRPEAVQHGDRILTPAHTRRVVIRPPTRAFIRAGPRPHGVRNPPRRPHPSAQTHTPHGSCPTSRNTCPAASGAMNPFSWGCFTSKTARRMFQSQPVQVAGCRRGRVGRRRPSEKDLRRPAIRVRRTPAIPTRPPSAQRGRPAVRPELAGWGWPPGPGRFRPHLALISVQTWTPTTSVPWCST
jgi:hypothetical protein